MSTAVSTDDDFGARRFKAGLLKQLESSGIGEDLIHVEYQDEIQSYDVLVDGGELTDEQIALLTQATRFACLRFTSPANNSRLHRVQERQARELMKARAAELVPKLVGLPRFDPSKTTLARFALELEVYCGFGPGTALQARGNNGLEIRIRSQVTLDQRRRLNDAITAALAQHDDVTVFIVATSI